MTRNLLSGLVAGLLLLSTTNSAMAQESSASSPTADAQEDAVTKAARDQLRALNWIKGPKPVDLFSNSSITVPENYVFLGTADTSKLESLEHNLSDGNEYFLAPKDMHWQALFRFTDDGYVKDDEKIDEAAILKSITDNTQRANDERRQRGWDEMEVVGWQTPPYYDQQSHHLEWAILGRDKKTGEQTVNFNTRILGRGGVMSVVLISEPEKLSASITELQDALKSFDYHSGQRYAEYRQGDKVAKYGLAALITGGAAAVAVKTGLWKVVLGAIVAGWKVVAAAAVALFRPITRLFKRKAA